MSKKLFYMILGGFIFTTISVLAYTLASGEVLYETSNNELVDGNSNGYIDVKDALDDLYDRIEQAGVDGYIVSYDTNGGNTLYPSLAEKNSNMDVSKLSTPKKEGYYFVGWYDAETGGNRVTTTTPITGDTTLYAHWLHTTATEKDGVNYFTTAQEVLYNPKTKSKCQTVGTSTPVEMSDCMKWYAYAEKDGIVYMILDHNIATTIKWYSSSSNNTRGPLTALASLKTLTDNAGWTTTVQGNYSTYEGYNGDTKKFTINYASEGYKARLLTAQEVAYITGKDSGNNSTWNERTATSSYYFGSLDSTNYSSQTEEQRAKQESFGWLFENLSGCGSSGCSNNSTVSAGNQGYWTSSPLAGSDSNVWYVAPYGSLTTSFDFTSNTNFGLRPVITVSTSEVFS